MLFVIKKGGLPISHPLNYDKPWFLMLFLAVTPEQAPRNLND